MNKYYGLRAELSATVQLSINDYESNVRSLNGLSVWVSVHSLQVALKESSANAILAGHIYETVQERASGREIDFLT